MKSADVLAIGSGYVDTNLENYPVGDDGIPAETELVGEAYEIVAGGSAVNFCRLLQELNVATTFIGMAGEDKNGDILAWLLQKAGIRSELIRRADLLTNISFNITTPTGKHIMLVAGTANAALNAEVVMPKLRELVPEAGMLYLGGCFKLKGLMPAFGDIADIADQSDTAIVVDHGRISSEIPHQSRELVKQLVSRAKYYFPSREEFCELWGASTIEQGLRLLNERLPNLTIVVKDGANGAYYYENGVVQNVPAVKEIEVVNLTGAGDSFNAGVIAAIVDKRPIVEAVAYGCKVAAARISGQKVPTLRVQ